MIDTLLVPWYSLFQQRGLITSIKCPKCQFDNTSDSKCFKECGTQLLPAEEIAVTETIEALKEELTRGTTLANRYEIIKELGKGGRGRVYRIEDKERDQVCHEVDKNSPQLK